MTATTSYTEPARPVDPFAAIPGAYSDDPYRPAMTKTVRDNASYAWRNSNQSCLTALPDDLVHDYRELLDTTAVAVMDGPTGALVQAWRAMGYIMLDCTEAAMGKLDRHVPDAIYHQAWDRAAGLLDGVALVDAAGLTEEYERYRALAEDDRDRDGDF